MMSLANLIFIRMVSVDGVGRVAHFFIFGACDFPSAGAGS
jgi:hypothetical protein